MYPVTPVTSPTARLAPAPNKITLFTGSTVAGMILLFVASKSALQDTNLMNPSAAAPIVFVAPPAVAPVSLILRVNNPRRFADQNSASPKDVGIRLTALDGKAAILC